MFAGHVLGVEKLHWKAVCINVSCVMCHWGHRWVWDAALGGVNLLLCLRTSAGACKARAHRAAGDQGHHSSCGLYIIQSIAALPNLLSNQ